MSNVYHVKMEIKPVNMQVQNLVVEKVLIIFWNVMDHQFLIQHYIVEQKNLVNHRLKGFNQFSN
jgi:hypothetical protein